MTPAAGSSWRNRFCGQRVRVLAVCPVEQAPLPVKGMWSGEYRHRGEPIPKPTTAVIYRAVWPVHAAHFWAWLTRRRFCSTAERFALMYERKGTA